MTHISFKIVDARHNVVATGHAADEGRLFGGRIDVATMPADLRRLFEEFEEIINGQMFSFLDEVQAKIAVLCLSVVFDNGAEAGIRDLQIYPSTGDVSFKIAEQTSNGPLRVGRQ